MSSSHPNTPDKFCSADQTLAGDINWFTSQLRKSHMKLKEALQIRNECARNAYRYLATLQVLERVSCVISLTSKDGCDSGNNEKYKEFFQEASRARSAASSWESNPLKKTDASVVKNVDILARYCYFSVVSEEIPLYGEPREMVPEWDFIDKMSASDLDCADVRQELESLSIELADLHSDLMQTKCSDWLRGVVSDQWMKGEIPSADETRTLFDSVLRHTRYFLRDGNMPEESGDALLCQVASAGYLGVIFDGVTSLRAPVDSSVLKWCVALEKSFKSYFYSIDRALFKVESEDIIKEMEALDSLFHRASAMDDADKLRSELVQQRSLKANLKDHVDARRAVFGQYAMALDALLLATSWTRCAASIDERGFGNSSIETVKTMIDTGQYGFAYLHAHRQFFSSKDIARIARDEDNGMGLFGNFCTLFKSGLTLFDEFMLKQKVDPIQVTSSLIDGMGAAASIAGRLGFFSTQTSARLLLMGELCSFASSGVLALVVGAVVFGALVDKFNKDYIESQMKIHHSEGVLGWLVKHIDGLLTEKTMDGRLYCAELGTRSSLKKMQDMTILSWNGPVHLPFFGIPSKHFQPGVNAERFFSDKTSLGADQESASGRAFKRFEAFAKNSLSSGEGSPWWAVDSEGQRSCVAVLCFAGLQEVQAKMLLF